jgi:hypothetical protein
MSGALRANVDIGDDEPVTLAEACRLFFGGRLTPSALRTEADKGNLRIMQIARKDFVTRAAIEEMKERCLRSPSRPVSGSAPSDAGTEPQSGHGASRTPAGLSAQDALRIRLQTRTDSSRATPPPSSSRGAEVVPLKSR